MSNIISFDYFKNKNKKDSVSNLEILEPIFNFIIEDEFEEDHPSLYSSLEEDKLNELIINNKHISQQFLVAFMDMLETRENTIDTWYEPHPCSNTELKMSIAIRDPYTGDLVNYHPVECSYIIRGVGVEFDED